MSTKKYFVFAALILTPIVAPIQAAYVREAGLSEQSNEAYQKEMEMYEASTRRNTIVTYSCLVILAAFLPTFFVISKRGKARSDKVIEVLLANQKVLEEIRDLLKAGRG